MQQTIELVCAGQGLDGVTIYAPPADALNIRRAVRNAQILHGAAWLLATYPREILHGLALVAVGALSVCMVAPPERKSAPRRRRRK